MLVGITSFIGQVVAQATSKARGADSDSASKNGNIGKVIAKNAVANNAVYNIAEDGRRYFDDKTTRFNLYQRWVKDGIILPEDIPYEVFETLAKEWSSYTDADTGKVTKNPDADFFYRLLIEQVKNGSVISDKEYLESIPKDIPGIKGYISSDFTIDKSHFAYKFANGGIDALSNWELKLFKYSLSDYARHRPKLGDKFYSTNEAIIHGLLKIGLEKYGLNTSDPDRRAIRDLIPAYEVSLLNDEEFVKLRNDGETLASILTFPIAAGSYGACYHSGGNPEKCGEITRAIGQVESAAYAAYPGYKVTSPAQLNPAMRVQFGLGRTQNAQKGNNGNAVTSDMSSTKTNSFDLTKIVDGISNFLSPSRRAEAKANAKEQAQKTIENNFYRDQEGFGVGFNEYRKLNPKEGSNSNVSTRSETSGKNSRAEANKGNHEWKQGTLAGQNYKKIVDNVPGVVLGRYDATTGPGPIEDLNKRKSFSGGRYATIKLTEDIVAYRAWTPGQSYEFGAYWALEKPRGSLQTTIDSAIIPEWGFLPNKVHIAQANQYTEIVIPAGTIINIGEVGSQSQRGPYVGAKTQLLIEGGAKPEWVVGRGKLQ